MTKKLDHMASKDGPRKSLKGDLIFLWYYGDKVPPIAQVLMMTNHYETKLKSLNVAINGCIECSLLRHA